ncbi:hydroxyacid dehydrogenase [Paenibacillus ginsengarvi]|uniref:Hydroxyacid dehydrogenase n=1 Tax=Paenibacillus ginsengarvi TaxID=400777 RepID=A0A3B0BQ91_9BACL|nr:hydroxyacid dehydrogenase [Paenibacillus ginsengarvi]RKN74197.1 hydroxyacid dehydrogenase [Paenibacillus ginsengarvi]
MTWTIALCYPPNPQRPILHERHLARLAELGRVLHTDWSDPEQARRTLYEADAAITSWGTPTLDEEWLRHCPRLRVVAHAAGTVKGLVSSALWERGIRVSSGNGPLGEGVAETALGMTIASLKNMWRIERAARAGGWMEERRMARELYQITVGVIGAGKAGTHFMKLLRPFQVRVLAYDPFVSRERLAELGATRTELDELIRGSDVVSIHAPLLPSTRHMLDRRRLMMMKDDAIAINTARAPIIDEEALIEQLSLGRLFACLDVTSSEPLPADHPLRSLPNCALTCHIAGAISNGGYRLGQFAVEELERFKRGMPLEGEVEREQMEILA